MKKRELADTVEQQYFDSSSTIPLKEDDGTRDIVPLLPFIISGGSNTERYYFTHISDTTKYKFHIKPEYFGDESNFTEIFPQRIERILERNADAKIFCVFDWDSIYKISPPIMKSKLAAKRKFLYWKSVEKPPVQSGWKLPTTFSLFKS